MLDAVVPFLLLGERLSNFSQALLSWIRPSQIRPLKIIIARRNFTVIFFTYLVLCILNKKCHNANSAEGAEASLALYLLP